MDLFATTIPIVGVLLTSLVPLSQNRAGARQDEALAAARAGVQDDVRILSRARFRGDIDTILDYSYTPIIDAVGGVEAARQGIEKSFARLQSAGTTLASLEFPEPPTFVAGDGRTFVIVPTKSVTSAGHDHRVLRMSFHFGVNEGDGIWSYIEGSRLSPELMAAFFPDFPESYELPEVSSTDL